MRPGVIIPSITKVKAKDNKSGIKSVKTKKVSKDDVKMQMKENKIKGKSLTAKGKTTKSVMKVKAVKKK